MQSKPLGDYIELSWSYAKQNINTVLEMPLQASNTDADRVSLVNIYVTTVPVGVGVHTAYIIHWNQSDTTLCQSTGQVVLSDHFLYLPIIWSTYSEAHTEQTHYISPTTSSIKFWVTYEDDTAIALNPADARFTITMSLKLS